MPIPLSDLPAAVRTYLDSKVTVTISTLTSTGATINPNEEFGFSVTAVNANAANGGVALKNVRWRLSVDNASIGKLKVPVAATGIVARSGPLPSSPPLAAGSEVAEMYLFPASAVGNYLHVGDTDTLTGLKGKAGGGAAGGTTTIRAKVLADIDMDQLFPANEDTPGAARPLTVVG